MNILITGHSGFYGSILLKFLQDRNFNIYGIDVLSSSLLPIENQVIADLTDLDLIASKILNLNVHFDQIIHLATAIDFAYKSQYDLYENNVKCTEVIINISNLFKINKVIFTSSNSIFLGNNKSYIGGDEIPLPIDEYGRSKIYSERILIENKNNFIVNILRCPNIIDAGRVGTLAILFELINSNSTLWVIGRGDVRHQCIYAQDLNEAIYKLLSADSSGVYNIGSNNVPTFKNMFFSLIRKAGSKSNIRSVPAWICLPLLKLFNKLRLSPFGPYQYRMLVDDFIFDISIFSKKFNWTPTKDNTEIIALAYKYYWDAKNNNNMGTSANSAPVKFGVLSLLKLIKF